MATAVPLRIGVVLDDTVVPAWIADLLQDLAAAETLELRPMLLRQSSQRRTARSAPGESLYALYRLVDAQLFASGPDPLEPTSLRDDLAAAAAQLETTDADDALDVILLLASGGDAADLASRARLGAWTVTCAGARSPDNGLAIFREMSQGKPSVTVKLLGTFAGEDSPRLIRRAVLPNDAVALGRSFAAVYWKAARLVSRELQAWTELGPPAMPEAESVPASGAPDPRASAPSVAELFLHVLRIASRATRSRARKALWREQWFLGYRADREAGQSGEDFRNLSVIDSPRGHFFADPFPIEVAGRRYLFFEDYRYAEKKAVISFVEFEENREPSSPQVALERPYHLSYPFVFKKDGQVFMLPETAANATVELYRAVSFPDQWERAHVLMSGIEVYDATLLEHEGRLWLFATVATKGSLGWDELSIFWTDSLEGSWRPHPRNPLVVDIRSARPAGRIFREGGRLIRPAQDCTRRYGRAIVFNEIQELSETEYRERVLGESRMISRAWRTHSYNAADGYVAVDGSRLVPRLPIRRLGSREVEL